MTEIERDYNRFQRKGSLNNARVGFEFEEHAIEWLRSLNIQTSRDFNISIGTSQIRKSRKFDLGSNSPQILVECKSHKWTEGNKVPSAKMTVWNEAMYYFLLAPPQFRKILFVLKDWSQTKGSTLGNYYVRRHSHLIPIGVEIWEYDETTKEANKLI